MIALAFVAALLAVLTRGACVAGWASSASAARCDGDGERGKGSGWDGDHARGPTVVPFFAHSMGAAAASRDDRTSSAWASHPPDSSLSLLSTRNDPQ